MEEKIKALKTSSKIISIIAKICYIAMIVAICICLSLLIIMAITGGQISEFTIGKTNFVIFDNITSTPTELAYICAVLVAKCSFLLAIFLLTFLMFNGISITGDPFIKKNVNFTRVIAILTAIMPIAVGIVECIATYISKIEISQFNTELAGMAVGAVIFCLSYIIDYGCAIKKQPNADNL